MPDMHDTRSYHGGGAEREPKHKEAVSAIPTAPLVRTEEECKNVWRHVNFKEGKLNGVRLQGALLLAAMCTAVLAAGWIAYGKMEEHMREDHDAMASQVQEFYFALERTAAAVDENRKATAVAPTPAVTIDNFVERTRNHSSEADEENRKAVAASLASVARFQDFVEWTPDGPYYGWRIVRMFDDLEVIHLRWDRALYEYYHYPINGVSHDPYEMDQYVHLEHVLYACAKRAPASSDWVDLRAHLSRFVGAAQGVAASLETLREFDHAVVTERYETEHVIGVMDGLWPEGAFYLHLDDTTYALAKDMQMLDVRKIEELKRLVEKAKLREEQSRQPAKEKEVGDSKAWAPLSLAELRQYDGEAIDGRGLIGADDDHHPLRCIVVDHLPYAYGERVGVYVYLSVEDYALTKDMKTLDVRALEDAHRSR